MPEADLKVEVTKSGPCERTLDVTIEPEAVKSEREKVITAFRKAAKINGFRPGKAPRELIARTFAESIRDEVMQNVISASLEKAIAQEDLVPLSRPRIEKVDFGEDDRLNFQARFEVRPEINLARYKKFKIEKKVHKVTDEDVEQAIENLRQEQARFIPKEGVAEKGDYLILDFCVLDEDGKPSPEARRTNQLLMAGHDDPLALFSHKLVGLGEGENQIIEIDFPEDYPDDSIRGRKISYRVDVKGVRVKSLPELDDHFAKQVSNAEDVSGLRKLVRESLEREIDRRANQQVEEEIFKQIIEANPFDVPSTLVNFTLERLLENYKRDFQQTDEQRLAEALRPIAEFIVKKEYIVAEIARKEQISVSGEEIQVTIEEFATQLDKPVEEIRKDFGTPEGLNRLRSLIQEEKVVQFLLENNDIKKVEE